MLVGIRKKHWLMLSLSATCFLLLLVFTAKPLTQPPRIVAGVGEMAFQRRRIAHDSGRDTASPSPPPPPPSPHPDPSQGLPGDAPRPPATPILAEAQSRALADQGVLLLRDEEVQQEEVQLEQVQARQLTQYNPHKQQLQPQQQLLQDQKLQEIQLQQQQQQELQLIQDQDQQQQQELQEDQEQQQQEIQLQQDHEQQQQQLQQDQEHQQLQQDQEQQQQQQLQQDQEHQQLQQDQEQHQQQLQLHQDQEQQEIQLQQQQQQELQLLQDQDQQQQQQLQQQQDQEQEQQQQQQPPSSSSPPPPPPPAQPAGPQRRGSDRDRGVLTLRRPDKPRGPARPRLPRLPPHAAAAATGGGSEHDQWLRRVVAQHQEFLKHQHHHQEARRLQQQASEQQTAGAPHSVTVIRRPASPRVTYESLKRQGESALQRILKREFVTTHRDTDFTPGEAVEPSQVRRVIVLSTWRSGSSYLGDLLRAYPGTFYSFEPLHHLLKNLHLEEGPLVDEAQELLRSILTCDYSRQDEYVAYLRNVTFLMRHNTRLWNSCALNRALCFDKEYVSRACTYMPVNVLKLVRMGVAPVVKLLEDEALGLRVIHLVRDPRGCLHSRLQLSWCQSPACRDPATVCQDMLTDLTHSDHLMKKYSDRYMVVRYEDLGLEPEGKAKEIFKFLGLSYNKYVSKYVKDHTTLYKKPKKRKDAYGTFRDSKATIFAWRAALDYRAVADIQGVCEEPLQRLGLRSFSSEDEYLNTTIPVLLG